VSTPDLDKSSVPPPVFVRGGKRLNFDREDGWTGEVDESFRGYGKDEGCYPSGTWEELCALATLIVQHPAYVPFDPATASGYYPPEIRDAQTSAETGDDA
jgi:hypothetical protein